MNGFLIRLIGVFVLAGSFSGSTAAQGLLFHGSEVDIAERSGLVLPAPDAEVKPVDKLCVRFSLRVNNVNSSGFVFGIKDRESGGMLNLMLRRAFAGDSVYLSFNREGEREFCSMAFKGPELLRHKLDVEISLDRTTDSGRVSIVPHGSTAGKTVCVESTGLGMQKGDEVAITALGLPKGEFRPQLNFGLTRHIVETASVTVADLTVERDGVVTVIPLNESEGERVHDAEGRVAGRAFNPQWQINEAYYWRKLAEFSSATPTGCAFDPSTRRFYSYNADSLVVYDDLTGIVSGIALTEARGSAFGSSTGVSAQGSASGPSSGMSGAGIITPFGTSGERGKLPVLHGMNLYSSRMGKIYPYEIYYNDFTAEIDPATGQWRRLMATDDNKAMHHHAHLLCGNDSAVLLFGGYGDRAYSNKLVRFDLYTHRFDTIPLKGDRIDPRFYASIGPTVSGDTLYLYGGKGNPEGRQDIGVKYYYDCYLISLKDSTARKLWTQERPERDRVPARTLLADPSGKYLYAMTYPEYIPHSKLQLYRISLADGSETAVGDTIPMISEEIATNVALYIPEEGEVIYCVVQEFEKEGATDTRIYSIAAPPVSRTELQVYAERGKGFGGWKWVWLGLGAASALGLVGMIVMKRRRAEESRVEESPEQLGSLGTLRTGEHPETIEQSGHSKHAIPSEALAESGVVAEKAARVRRIERPMLPERDRISLFGPFTAIDAGGHDVSHLFSPKLRAIFIYILLGTWRKGGVTASELSATFWPDKEADKIKNLRNVTIAKLRKILGEFTGLEVVYDDGRFTVSTGGNAAGRDMSHSYGGPESAVGCYVDVSRLLTLTNNMTKEPSEPGEMAEVEAIVLQGKFLQGIEAVELDRYKGAVEAFALDVMLKGMERYADMRAWEEVTRFSHLALLTDPVNEAAMRYGVKGYEATGNRSRARSLYDGFAANYRKIYGEEYGGRFNDI